MKLLPQILIFIIAIFCSNNSVAQLCQGSLGDPIVNINFGQGNNPAPALNAAVTNYSYSSADCPPDGSYTIRNNTTQCFGNTWQSLQTDHTGNGNGYFLLVNASVQPSAFYTDTVRNLCANTTYEFAAWVLNVIMPSACGGTASQPNITFTIERTDGTILQVYNTNNIPPQSSPTWQQFGFFFSTPVAVQNIVLRMTNNAAGGCGNDLALDDITFRPCGPKLTPSINGNETSADNFCEGIQKSYTFSCTSTAGYNSPVYQWQQSTDGMQYTDIVGQNTTGYAVTFLPNALPGKYYYRLTTAEAGNINSAQCRIASTPFVITINSNPNTTVNSNSPICQNNLLTLQATGGDSFNWVGSNNFTATGAMVSKQNVQLIDGGKYVVTVTNAAGCSKKDSINVVVNAAPIATVQFTDTTVCFNQTLQLLANGGPKYLWQPKATLSNDTIPNPIAKPTDSTTYNVTVTNSFGCTDTAFVTVKVVQKPSIDAGPDKFIVANKSVQLQATATANVKNIVWQPNIFITDNTLLNPFVNPPTDTKYFITVMAANNCGSITDSVSVKIYNGIYIPNAFTPNADGVNDTWNIPALEAYPLHNLAIFNRYGQLVFKRSKSFNGWDGTLKGQQLPVGTYTYIINLNDGTSLLKGTVILLK